eukprot:TRINITY_DN2542_c0_g1_i7.p1 TRINITY_DN2542_c0_g1~~TRINITY_DN2542_c0_g1_i7.p1  ORF type:complete len:517 (+),score=224.15 TRINITY_DN2542_c0_g1_i7:470-2020(+)
MCGRVAQWKRPPDPVSGKFKGFGFCDYQNAEGVLRAIRVLDKLKIDGSELLVKVDEKTQRYLSEYHAKTQAMLRAAKAKEQHVEDGELVDEEQDSEDVKVRGIIHQLLIKRDRGEVYTDAVSDEINMRRDSERLAEMRESFPDDGNKAQLVSKEIKFFRERQAQREIEKREKISKPDENDEAKSYVEREKRKREEREYKEKERVWEEREKAKEREKEREIERKEREKDREAIDLDYDFEAERKRHPKEYYRRKKDRQREAEEDVVDAQREIELMKQQEEENRLKKERDEQRRLEERQRSIEMAKARAASAASAAAAAAAAASNPPVSVPGPIAANPPYPPFAPPYASYSPGETSVLAGAKLSGIKFTEKKVVAPGFAIEEPEEEQSAQKKRKLVTLETALHEDNTRQAKLEQAKSVIERIPTEKEKLFDFPMEWDVVEKMNIVEDKMRPWITKMIGELLGEEEKSLIDFITSKIVTKMPAKAILEQLKLVLDEEAETFVIKLWRKLIFEMLSAKPT